MIWSNVRALQVTLVLASVGAHAQQAEPPPQPEQPNAVVEIKQRLMYFKIGAGQGFEGLSLYQNGKRLNLGFFGGNVGQHFSDFPEALDLANTYRTQKTVGLAMSAVGLAALVADLGYLWYIVSANDQAAFRGTQGLIWGLLGGGALVGVVGGMLVQMSFATLSEAVNKHNAGLLNQYLPPGHKIDLQLAIGPEQQGVGLSYRF